jgi:diguanylate cyclase (GGDEF)-like protein
MTAPLPLPIRSSGDPTLAILGAMAEAAWVVDGALFIIMAGNEAAEQLLGRGPLTGLDAERALETLEDAAYWDEVRGGLRPTLESDTEIVRPDGSTRSVSRRIAPIDTPEGYPLFLVQLRDRTQERAIEHDRETALAELRATLEATADAILVTNLAGDIRAFNRRFAALWSLPESLVHGAEDRSVYQWMRMNVMDVDAYDRRLDEVHAHTLAEAHDTLALVTGALIERHSQPQWSQGRPIGRVFSFRERNPRRAGAPREQGADGLDPMTRLPNRTGFVGVLDEALRLGRDSAGFTVLCLEFDGDALFGDGGGSTAGARRLSELASQVRGAIRQPHHCARLGGSRFGVLIPDASEAAAEAAARRLIENQDRPGGVRVSVGIGAYPGAGLSADEILRHAEIAMHRAQQQSRSAVVVHRFGFESWQRRRDRLEEGLRRAAEEGRLRLVHQARFDRDAVTAVSVEVQLRWRDRELGEIAPAQFQSVAEERGLVGALDDWALERGLMHARRWRDQGYPWRLNVNVSGWQLVQPGFARRVAGALEAAAWPAEDLEIDVTEDALETDPEAALAAVRSLARQGVRVILEGFGAEAASLSLLRRLPLSGIKLDPALVQGSARGGAESSWLPMLVALVRSLGIEVHADGVDSDAQRAAMLVAGCDGLQGRRCGPWMEDRGLEAWMNLSRGADLPQ